MKKLLLIFLTILLTGCSTTIVWAPKYVEIKGQNQDIEIDAEFKGSDIEDLKANQKADGKLEIPLIGQ